MINVAGVTGFIWNSFEVGILKILLGMGFIIFQMLFFLRLNFLFFSIVLFNSIFFSFFVVAGVWFPISRLGHICCCYPRFLLFFNFLVLVSSRMAWPRTVLFSSDGLKARAAAGVTARDHDCTFIPPHVYLPHDTGARVIRSVLVAVARRLTGAAWRAASS